MLAHPGHLTGEAGETSTLCWRATPSSVTIMKRRVITLSQETHFANYLQASREVSRE